MPGLQLLDVAIGLFFVFLLLSLICSALSEMIEALLRFRARDLHRGISELLAHGNGEDYVSKLYSHPLVAGLYKGSYDSADMRSLPSYIPARNFALALMDVALAGDANTRSGAAAAASSTPAQGATAAASSAPAQGPAAGGALQPLRDSVSKITNAGVRTALTVLIDAANHDAEQARKNIEAWYDSAMDRASGWYKRRTQWITFWLGMAVAIALNVDAIVIGTSLSKSTAMREAFVAAAQNYTERQLAPQSNDGPAAHGAQGSAPPATAPSGTAGPAAPAAQGSSPPAKEQSPADHLKATLDELDKQARNVGLPIGWDRDGVAGGSFIERLLTLFGWFLTAAAISLGAPFWFDLLNKFMVVRSTVKPKEKSKESESED